MPSVVKSFPKPQLGLVNSIVRDYPSRQIADHFQTISESPAAPTLFIRFMREGVEEVYEVHPTDFEYVSSVTAADMVQFTVPDEALQWIDNRILTEDLKTEVIVNFGYVERANMSGDIKLVFYRQRPTFPQDGPITTTITAYDKGILLALPTVPRVLTPSPSGRGQVDRGLTVKQMVELLVEEVNRLFKAQLKVDFGEGTFTSRYYRMHKGPGSPIEWLFYLRTVAEEDDGNGVIEVFVQDDTVYFRPKPKRDDPVAVYFYHFPAYGHQLLSFEPEVNLTPTRKTAQAVEQGSGKPVASSMGAGTPQTDPKMMAAVNYIDGSTETRPAGRKSGKVEEKLVDVDSYVTHEVAIGDTWQSIAAHYGMNNPAMLAEMNGLTLDDPLPKTVKVRIQAKITEAEAKETDETRAQVALSYLYEEDYAVRARATVLGDPKLRAGQLIGIYNVGVKWSGPWYIEEVKHRWDEGGYICELALTRDGFPIGEGLETKAATDTHEVIKNVKDVDPKKNPERKAGVNYRTGETR